MTQTTIMSQLPALFDSVEGIQKDIVGGSTGGSAVKAERKTTQGIILHYIRSSVVRLYGNDHTNMTAPFARHIEICLL
jgi:hypothetical protein